MIISVLKSHYKIILLLFLNLSFLCVYVYVHVHVCVRETETETDRDKERTDVHVSWHPYEGSVDNSQESVFCFYHGSWELNIEYGQSDLNHSTFTH